MGIIGIVNDEKTKDEKCSSSSNETKNVQREKHDAVAYVL